MQILDEKSGEVLDKDISRPECPFRSITDLKRKYYKSGEDYEPDTTLTQAEQYVPIIKMIEKMLHGEDVEFIKELMKPAKSYMPDINSQEVEDALDGVVPNDADPTDYFGQTDLSTEKQASEAPNKPEQANSSSGEVASEQNKATQEALE